MENNLELEDNTKTEKKLNEYMLYDLMNDRVSPRYSISFGESPYTVSVSTHVEGGSSIFTFKFSENHYEKNPVKKNPIFDEELVSAMLEYLNSGKFENDLKKVCQARGYTTTAEQQLLRRLDRKELGDRISTITFSFPTSESATIDYICGMNYEDFSQMAEMVLEFSQKMFEKKLELEKEISQRKSFGE